MRKKKPESSGTNPLPSPPGTAGMEKINNPDPFGSYTGTAAIPFEKPVQDADDL